MNYVFIVIFISFIYLSKINCKVNKLSEFANIFLEPSTKLFDVSDPELNLKANGIVVGIDPDGTYNTICVDHDGAYDQLGNIICNRLGYKGSRKSYVLISSSGKSVSYETTYKIKSCTTTDCDLELVSGDFNCLEHRQDLHVFCPNSYSFTSSEICTTPTSCTVEKGASNALTIVQGTNKYLICGRRRNFQTDEAKLFCKLLGQPTTSSRIVESIGYKGIQIGGFIKMSCPANATNLSECTGKEPNDREGCNPSDSIGVVCSNINVFAPVVPPNLTCNSTWVAVVWNDTTITKDNFDILKPDKTVCSDTIKTLTGPLRIIEMKLNNCGMIRNGEGNDTLDYQFLARRSYVQENLELKTNELFSLTCSLPRLTSNTTGPVLIEGSQINPGGGTLNIPTVLTLYRDVNFKFKVSSVTDISLGNKVFVLVSLVDPPSNIVLILLNCRVTISGELFPLIINKCPNAAKKVEIIPQDYKSMGFSFESFTKSGEDAKVTCDSTKCVKDDTGCDQTC